MTDSAHTALVRDVARRLLTASHDEVRVVSKLLDQLEFRRHRAGPLSIRDRRDWRAELGDGLLNAVIYCALETLRAEDEARANLQAVARAEMLDEWNPGQRTVASPVPAAIAVAIDDMRDTSSGPYLAIKVDDPTRKR